MARRRGYLPFLRPLSQSHFCVLDRERIRSMRAAKGAGRSSFQQGTTLQRTVLCECTPMYLDRGIWPPILLGKEKAPHIGMRSAPEFATVPCITDKLWE